MDIESIQYLIPENPSDPEKSFLHWIKDNNSIFETHDQFNMQVLKKCYVDAFYSGFNYKLQYSAEEQLQK
jgi:hypothetical protein